MENLRLETWITFDNLSRYCYNGFMKSISILILFTLNIYLFLPDRNPQIEPEQNRKEEMIAQQISDFPENTDEGLDDDEDLFFYEQETFSRKLYQRKLPPLNKKEKIIWAFRMAESDLFL